MLAKLLFEFFLCLGIAYARPAPVDVGFGHFRFHIGRRHFTRGLGNVSGSRHHERLSLHLRLESAGFRHGGEVYIRVALNGQALNRPAGPLIDDIDVGAVIVNGAVVISDVGHVHRLVDVSDVLRWSEDALAQNRLTDVAYIDEVVVSGADIELDIHLARDGTALIDGFVRGRQRRPSDILVAGAPGNPSRTPFHIFVTTGNPDPALTLKTRPASVVVGGPTEVFVGDPRPAYIRVGPIAVRIGSPVGIARHVGLPAIAVIADLNPVAAGEIVVKEIHADIRPGHLSSSAKADQHR